MADTNDFVKYDMQLPSRASLKRLIAIGRLMIAVGAVGLLWSFVQFAYGFVGYERAQYDRPNYCGYNEVNTDLAADYNWLECQPAPVFSAEWFYGHWYLVMVPLMLLCVGGNLVAARYRRRLTEYYYEVRQGRIIERDTCEGGDYRLRWEVLVEGYTYANELRRQWRRVNAGYWHDAKIGDWIDQR